jgi:hypothetical protein
MFIPNFRFRKVKSLIMPVLAMDTLSDLFRYHVLCRLFDDNEVLFSNLCQVTGMPIEEFRRVYKSPYENI